MSMNPSQQLDPLSERFYAVLDIKSKTKNKTKLKDPTVIGRVFFIWMISFSFWCRASRGFL